MRIGTIGYGEAHEDFPLALWSWYKGKRELAIGTHFGGEAVIRLYRYLKELFCKACRITISHISLVAYFPSIHPGLSCMAFHCELPPTRAESTWAFSIRLREKEGSCRPMANRKNKTVIRSEAWIWSLPCSPICNGPALPPKEEEGSDGHIDKSFLGRSHIMTSCWFMTSWYHFWVPQATPPQISWGVGMPLAVKFPCFMIFRNILHSYLLRLGFAYRTC